MTEKERFVHLAQSGQFTITQLCDEFSISRKTGQKYLKRFEQEGREGLLERSSRPKYSTTATDEAIDALILTLRRKHPTWGLRKSTFCWNETKEWLRRGQSTNPDTSIKFNHRVN